MRLSLPHGDCWARATDDHTTVVLAKSFTKSRRGSDSADRGRLERRQTPVNAAAQTVGLCQFLS
jgi:hypothetical protein